MSSSLQLLAVFLCGAFFAKGDGENQNSVVKPTAAGYEYGVTNRNFGQWTGSQLAYPSGVAGAYGSQGWKAGTSWPHTMGHYNPFGSNTWNPTHNYGYASNPTGNKFTAFGSSGYPQNPYSYENYGGAYNPVTTNRYQALANSGSGRTWNTPFSVGTYNNPFSTPSLNAYGPRGVGYNNGIGGKGFYNPYSNNPYQYNTAVSVPSTGTITTTTPKYSFGTNGFSSGYNPSTIGSTGYDTTGYNSITYGPTAQEYNVKYESGFKPWMAQDNKFSGAYGYQAVGKPGYQTYIASPGIGWNRYGLSKTGYTQ